MDNGFRVFDEDLTRATTHDSVCAGHRSSKETSGSMYQAKYWWPCQVLKAFFHPPDIEYNQLSLCNLSKLMVWQKKISPVNCRDTCTPLCVDLVWDQVDQKSFLRWFAIPLRSETFHGVSVEAQSKPKHPLHHEYLFHDTGWDTFDGKQSVSKFRWSLRNSEDRIGTNCSNRNRCTCLSWHKPHWFLSYLHANKGMKLHANQWILNPGIEMMKSDKIVYQVKRVVTAFNCCTKAPMHVREPMKTVFEICEVCSTFRAYTPSFRKKTCLKIRQDWTMENVKDTA